MVPAFPEKPGDPVGCTAVVNCYLCILCASESFVAASEPLACASVGFDRPVLVRVCVCVRRSRTLSVTVRGCASVSSGPPPTQRELTVQHLLNRAQARHLS